MKKGTPPQFRCFIFLRLNPFCRIGYGKWLRWLWHLLGSSMCWISLATYPGTLWWEMSLGTCVALSHAQPGSVATLKQWGWKSVDKYFSMLILRGHNFKIPSVCVLREPGLMDHQLPVVMSYISIPFLPVLLSFFSRNHFLNSLLVTLVSGNLG